MKIQPKKLMIAVRFHLRVLWIFMGAIGLAATALADPNTTLPFRDTFEQYTNGTRLVDGTTNGWYGTTNDDVAGATNMIQVQNEAAYLSAQSVAVPVEHTLSNRFELLEAATSVWLQVDVRVVLTDDDLDDGADPPRTLSVDNTNASALFYVNTSGYFVVHNGPASPSPTNSTNWVVLSGGTQYAESEWVRVKAHMDYANTNWSLMVNRVELTNSIRFLNPATTNFSGFDLYNGIVANTTYMDNVYISRADDSPDLKAAPSSVSRVTVQSLIPAGTNLLFINSGPGSYDYEVLITNAWLSSTVTNGTLNDSDERTNTIPLTFDASIATWGRGISNTVVILSTTNNGGVDIKIPVTVQVLDWSLLDDNDERVMSLAMTNKVMLGNTPTQQYFSVTNYAGAAGALTCSVASTMAWLTPEPAGFTNAVGANQLLANTFANTADWAPGASQATVNVVSGEGFTQSVSVVLNVMQMTNTVDGEIAVNVMEGGFLPQSYSFGVVNRGPGSFDYTAVVASDYGATNWVINTVPSGSVRDYGTNSVTLTFRTNYNQAVGEVNTALVNVVSTHGGGATNQIRLLLTVSARPEGTNLSFYASTNGPNIEPYTNWSMAATNIQDVMAIVQDENNVFLSNGTFNLTSTVTITNSIVFQGWETNPANTILAGDGSTNYQGMVINNTGALVSAVTVLGGNGGVAGVCMTNGGTLSNCWVTACTGTVGGVLASNNAQLISCVVSGNVGDVVGGVDLQGALLLDSTIVGNVSTGEAGYGGGVSMGYQSNNLVSNCVIVANTATNIGGGVAMVGGDMVSCTVALNTQSSATGGGGGGIAVMGTNAEQAVMIRLTRIESNTAATAVGGGVLFTNAPEYSRTLRNCLISSNAPGGVYQAEAVAGAAEDTIESCTIAHNAGTGLHLVAGQANVYVRNNIVYFNGTDINTSLGATANGMSNNCAHYAEFPAQGNITNDPSFIDANAFDYHLAFGSPCIWAGTNQDWMADAVDLDGIPRAGLPSVDIGAYAADTWSWLLTYEGQTNQFTLTNQVMLGRTPSEQTLTLVNQGAGALDYVVTNADWLSGSYSNGRVEAGSNHPIQAVYSATPGWTPGTSNAILTVWVTNQSILQSRSVPVVLHVMDLKASVTGLTRSVMSGFMPSNTTLVVSNAGAGEFAFVVTNTAWMSGSSTNGVLGPYSNQTIDIKYDAGIAGWGPGSSNTAISITSTNGGGATQLVSVTVNIMHLNVTPPGVTNSVMLGETPDSQAISVQNTGGGTFSYVLASDTTWATPTPAGGTIGPDWSDPIQIDYGSTADWTPGVSNAMLTIVSTNGGGSTQTVSIVLNVVELLPPTGVSASKGTYTDKIALTWNPAVNATSYQIWRNTINDAVTAQLQGSSTNAFYDDAAVTQGVIYYYWLKSVNALGVSVFSATDYGARNLPVPTGVSATKRTYTDKVRVTWTAVANATGYQVWRNLANNTATATQLGGTTSTTYDDATAVKETTYYYWLKATNRAAISGFSAPDTGIRKEDTPVPAAPTGLTASKGAHSDKVALTWTASAYAGSYEVWRNTVSDSSAATKIATPTSASYNDTAADAGTWYYYWVKAKNVTGVSGFSGVASGYRLDLSMAPMFGDFDGDRKSDPAVYQRGTGRWFVKLSASGYATAGMNGFGGSGYTAFVADYDGDGMVDLGIFEQATGNWQVKLSGSGYSTATVLGFGDSRSVVVPFDFDGDGKADPAIYNTVNGYWRIMLSGSGYGIATVAGFGGTGFTQVTGNYDADTLADPAIYGDSTGNWAVMLSGSGYGVAALPGFGGTGSEPLSADFDGDGLTDLAFYRESTKTWYIKLSGSGYGTAILSNFGGAGYEVGATDFDGDRKADPSLFQDATQTWHIKPSAGGYATVTIDSGYTP